MLEAEDIPTPREPSNAPPARLWPLVAVACRQAAAAAGRPGAVRALLQSVMEATCAERAFLVASGEASGSSKPRVEIARSLREDGRESPSRSVLHWALSDTAPRAGLDLLERSWLAGDGSVRGLGLRCVMAAGVPRRQGDRAALVLDSRLAPSSPLEELLGVLEAFAGLLGLVLSDSADPSPPRRSESAGDPPVLVGSSRQFREMLERVQRVASWRLPALIVGESGTGKEAVARSLHLEGIRRHGPFVAVNCAAIPESLLESEIFGAVRGAYTGSDQDRPGLFRLAHGGTLFLDEVGDMPGPMQAKLLRVLQDGRVRPVGGKSDVAVDVRLVAATHRDLRRLAAEGRFRADLLYRLAMVQIRIPALRERPRDIPPLVAHLAARLEADTGVQPIRVSECAMRALAAHSWPGNVRELHAVLARGLLSAGDGEIRREHLEIGPDPGSLADPHPETPALERAMIEAALRAAEGNLTRAAARIGWSRPKLYRRMSALGLERERESRRRREDAR